VAAVEAHSFEPLGQLCWRNSDLDFSGLDALLDSLTVPPPGPGLVRGNNATDLETLSALAREPGIRDLARGRSRVRLLWDACQIPDYRKITDESHTRLCAKVFGHVLRDGGIPTDWIAGQIAALARADGDIDTLMQRLAGVRVWTYVAARADWLRDAAHWQARARQVEDLLSDALHERLTSRFVDRRAAMLMRRLDAGDAEELFSAVTRRGEVVVEGHPVGHIEGFSFVPDPLTDGDERRLVLRAARRALREEMPRRVARLEAAEDISMAWLPSQRIAWDGAAIARLRPGASALRPQVEVLDSEFLDGPQREGVRLRVQRFVDAEVREALAPLLAASAAADADPMLRGPLHRLVEGLGVVAGATEHDVPPPLRGRLKALGVRAGRLALFLPALLKPRVAARRAALWALAHGVPVPGLPGPGLVSLSEPPADWPEGFAAAMGWVATGPVLLRLDIAERVTAELAWSGRFRPIPIPSDLASRLAVRSEVLPAVLRGLGFRLLPAGSLAEGQFGPPCPPLMAPQRHRRSPPHPQAPRPAPECEGPFAVLSTLRRYRP
jgi:ATP-dependent RNA helicase SUPV3L1/SUV3